MHHLPSPNGSTNEGERIAYCKERVKTVPSVQELLEPWFSNCRAWQVGCERPVLNFERLWKANMTHSGKQANRSFLMLLC